jgi:excinuclease ABC subunit A
MAKRPPGQLIRLRGVRHNNLKNFDLDLPVGRLIVVTGVSGSGKSSLAFDTLYAEGQRRYIETFSPYARQFFERMDKPQVDSIQGIPPAIAIEQRNAVKSTRSTVGTMTEICDYMKVVWARVAQLHCSRCGQPVKKDSPQSVWQQLQDRAAAMPGGATQEVLITFDVPLSDKLSLAESLELIAKQGYQRVLLSSERAHRPPEVVRLEEVAGRLGSAAVRSVTIVQDRIKMGEPLRARFVEACEQAYHFGKGKLALHSLDGSPARRFSNRLHCAHCDLEYREPSPALFSFNHPVGACPVCRGFGRTITIDYDLALPDRSLTLEGGAVRPWQTGQSAECQDDLMQYCRKRRVPVNVPFERLSPEWQRWVIEGDPDYGKDAQHEWPQAWYGIKGYFRWLESRAYKMHVRVLLSRYRAYQTCVTCAGRRFQPEALLFKRSDEKGQLLTLADFYQLPVNRALQFVGFIAGQYSKAPASDPLKLVFGEVCSRLAYLEEVGLGYLTLDRPTRSLSGGETERVNLTTCLGSRLVNTLFVLDEPSVGLHARDTQRLITILERLRDTGNTVVVVEHEPSVMRAADQLVDLGPGHGEAGGAVVFQGTFAEILKSPVSLTGQYLRGHRRIEARQRRPVHGLAGPRASSSDDGCPILTVQRARRHNLKDLTVGIPLRRFVCITGVSGSGKTTLVREVLLPRLNARFAAKPPSPSGPELEADSEPDAEVLSAGESDLGSEQIAGWEHLGRVVLVDQSSLGKTPRSNPAVYIGAFEPIRELFAQSESARQRGLNASAFSFNSAQGQCELCRGAGFEKIEMQFLSDVFVRCPACNGRRYRQHILEVTLAPPSTIELEGAKATRTRSPAVGRRREWSIADLLDATVDECVTFLSSFGDSRPATRALERLRLLQDVGLGYLRLGQPINTLSGGESQRLKLVSYLADFTAAQQREEKPTLFLFDEPTTGLHFADVEVLVQVFQRLVDQGHSVIVVEHNLDLIKCADWVIDLGPEAGESGGRLVAQGTPEDLAACAHSYTGQSLREACLAPSGNRHPAATRTRKG